EDAVEPLELLLLAQPQPVLRLLAAPQPVHAGRRAALVLVVRIDRALGREAALPLQVELHLLPPTHLADRVNVPCHGMKAAGGRDGQGSIDAAAAVVGSGLWVVG